MMKPNKAAIKRAAVIGATAIGALFVLNTAANAFPVVARFRNYVATGAKVPMVGGTK